MNAHQATGEGEGLLGKAKEMLGGLTGHHAQQDAGQANQGGLRQGGGNVRQDIGNAVGRNGGQKAAGQGD